MRIRILHILLILLILLSNTACRDHIMTYGNGEYTGSIINNKPEGYGIYKQGNNYCEGMWKNGLLQGMGCTLVNDSLYKGNFKLGKRDGQGVLTVSNDSAETCYSGEWYEGQRQGQGSYTDSRKKQTWKGTWIANTLVSGTLTDSTGVYTGSFNKEMQPEGFGKFISSLDGNFYEGHWHCGKHQGFGFELNLRHGMQCGWWKNGNFLGERMYYTSTRIYGIDISHYQHGRRPTRHFKGCPINWNALRITYLGSNTKNSIGKVDYPVSFCYIKYTQGNSISNPYCRKDLLSGRLANIRMGTYHFMSPSAGRPQAIWFINHTPTIPNDLPPMLDVELTTNKIQRMGGVTTMFNEMLAWLHIVEKRMGKRPILYLSQRFINKYMSLAPPELLNYHVWIARYSEYRPYVRLLYWQLTPKGKVTGIRGDVDINVFNGNTEQWSRYVSSGQTIVP